MIPPRLDKTKALLGLFAALAAAFVVSLNLGAFSAEDAPVPQAQAAVDGAPADRVGVPTRIVIPAIGLDAAIEKVGLTRDGAMDAPHLPMRAGWLGSSARPGEAGNAVLDGHRGWRDKIPAAFDRVHELSAGDLIYVEDASGKARAFAVRELRAYGKDDDASAAFAPAKGARLTLITCDGDWDPATQSYERRLVVIADRS